MWLRRAKKVVKITGMAMAGLLLLLYLLPILFPQKVSRSIKAWANQKIEGELNFSKARLSFFRHFPSLTLTLYDFSLKGSKPFEKDTLLAGEGLSFGIDIASLFGSTIRVSKFYVDNAFINVQVDSLGHANYNVYRGDTTKVTGSADEANTALKIEGIFLDQCRLVYHDRSVPMYLEAENLHYSGRGDLSESVFDLKSKLRADNFQFVYDGTTYLERKKLEAGLVTQINTESLALEFRENDLMINKLPVEFKGRFAFIGNGYDIDFHLVSGTTGIENVFSIIPPAYAGWLEPTIIKGASRISASLTGAYRAETLQSPSLHAEFDLKDGYLNHRQAPQALEQFRLKATLDIPSLSLDSAALRVSDFGFALGGDKTYASLEWRGYTHPELRARVNSKLNMAMLVRAIGLQEYDLKGMLNLDLAADGRYRTEEYVVQGRRQTRVVQIPVFRLQTALADGYLKTPFYPQPLESIVLRADISSAKGTMQDLKVDIHPMAFQLEGEPFSVDAAFSQPLSLVYNIAAKGRLNIGRIYKIFAVNGYNAEGIIEADLSLAGTQADAEAGRLERLKNSGTLQLKNIAVQSALFPQPFLIPQGNFRFTQEKAWLTHTTLQYGNNRVQLDGYASNYGPYFFNTGVLTGELGLQSDALRIDDFMTAAADTAAVAAGEDGVVPLPENLDLKLKAGVRKLDYNGMVVKNLQGAVWLHNGVLDLERTQLEMAGTKVALQAHYQPVSANTALFSMNIKADSFDVKRAYSEVDFFRDMASGAKYAEGLISLNYQLQGKLNEHMYPVLPSLKGQGELKLENVKLKGMKLFGAVSKATSKDSINNPNLKAVVIKSSIANNLLTIPRTRMKIMGFRPRIEGQVSLDGRFNLKFRLGLPPFGIIGIPMSVTGTAENPVVKMRGGSEEDILEAEAEVEKQ